MELLHSLHLLTTSPRLIAEKGYLFVSRRATRACQPVLAARAGRRTVQDSAGQCRTSASSAGAEGTDHRFEVKLLCHILTRAQRIYSGLYARTLRLTTL